MASRSPLGRSINLGRYGPVSVALDPSLFVILALLGWQPGATLAKVLLWVAVATGCILVHELGHAAAFVAFGRRPSVLLYGFGGVTSAEAGLGSWASLVVSLAGPIAGFALGAAIFLVADPTPGTLWHAAYGDALWATVGLGIFNLLPVLPLDGGSALRSFLRGVAGKPGDTAAIWISILSAGALGFVGLRFGQIFAGLFGFMFAAQSWQLLKEDRREPRRLEVKGAYDALLAGRYEEASDGARRALAGGLDPGLREIAAEVVVWARMGLGDVPGARAALGLRRSPGDQRPTPKLAEAAIALAEGAGEPALAVLGAALDQDEWAPPAVLIPLLERIGALGALRARLSPSGAELLDRLVAARG